MFFRVSGAIGAPGCPDDLYNAGRGPVIMRRPAPAAASTKTLLRSAGNRPEPRGGDGEFDHMTSMHGNHERARQPDGWMLRQRARCATHSGWSRLGRMHVRHDDRKNRGGSCGQFRREGAVITASTHSSLMRRLRIALLIVVLALGTMMPATPVTRASGDTGPVPTGTAQPW